MRTENKNMSYRYDSQPFVDVSTLDQDTRIAVMLYGQGDIVAVIPGYDVQEYNVHRGNGRQRRGTATRKYYVRFAGLKSQCVTGYTDKDAIERANSWVNLEAPFPVIDED